MKFLFPVILLLTITFTGCEDICEECNDALTALCRHLSSGNCDPSAFDEARYDILSNCNTDYAGIAIGYMAESCFEDDFNCALCEDGSSFSMKVPVLFIADADIPVDVEFSIPAYPDPSYFDITAGTAISIETTFEQDHPYAYTLYSKADGSEMATSTINFTFNRPGNYGTTRKVLFSFDLFSGYSIVFEGWE